MTVGNPKLAGPTNGKVLKINPVEFRYKTIQCFYFSRARERNLIDTQSFARYFPSVLFYMKVFINNINGKIAC